MIDCPSILCSRQTVALYPLASSTHTRSVPADSSSCSLRYISTRYVGHKTATQVRCDDVSTRSGQRCGLWLVTTYDCSSSNDDNIYNLFVRLLIFFWRLNEWGKRCDDTYDSWTAVAAAAAATTTTNNKLTWTLLALTGCSMRAHWITTDREKTAATFPHGQTKYTS